MSPAFQILSVLIWTPFFSRRLYPSCFALALHQYFLVSSTTIKHCADELTSVLPDILTGLWGNAESLLQRTQVVKINNKFSKVKYNSIGAPQGCVLSTRFYSLSTNDCMSHTESVKMFTFADDTTLVGLISDFLPPKPGKETQPLYINGAVESVSSLWAQ